MLCCSHVQKWGPVAVEAMARPTMVMKTAAQKRVKTAMKAIMDRCGVKGGAEEEVRRWRWRRC